MRTIGVDTGGTFTDLVLADGDELSVVKVPSTPRDPADAVVGGLERLHAGGAGDTVVHGTTVALNALLTGRVARTALVTGAGFRDLVEIGRQERPDIYALHPIKPEPLVPRSLRFEVAQRSWPDPAGGRATELVEVAAPSADELERLRERVAKSGAQSVAICLLHSWADPAIEERVAAALAPLGLPLTLSAHVLAEHREYERFSTAIVNAVLVPIVRAYLAGLERRLPDARLLLLQSNGGTLPASRAALEPVRVLLSGPAGGVVGAARAAREAGLESIVTLDMGGTSTDVAFHDARAEGVLAVSGGTGDPVRVAGHPVAVPTLDIHTIGCGGGSLVRVDAGGVLHVGPASAGADPGPVCYGHSDEPTVTDAHVLLGHVAEGAFLGGELALDHDAVARAFERLARRLGAAPAEAAQAVLEVARAAMRRAVGVMTMQRGHDPRRLALVAFGGAGGLHAAALAASLGMRRALVPCSPGALSARGMTAADAIRDLSRTALEPLGAWSRARRRAAFRELAHAGRSSLVEAGHPARAVAFEHGLDLRYAGQSFELRVPEGEDVAGAFHAVHERRYGYRLEGREVELVCLRTRAIVRRASPVPANARSRPLPADARLGLRAVRFGSRVARAPLLARARLRPGHAFEGPALVEEYSGTTLVPPRWSARVTAGSHLLLEAPQRD